jgi:ECF sigma factor
MWAICPKERTDDIPDSPVRLPTLPARWYTPEGPNRGGGRETGARAVGDVTTILTDIERGHRRASGPLLLLAYDERRESAAVRLAREAPEQSLQATALAHEADLRLVGNPAASAPGEAARRGAGLLRSPMPGMHT